MSAVALGPSDKLHTSEGKRSLCKHSHNPLEPQELGMLKVPLV